MKHVIAGTAGHIDHGKTELVKALTGVDCDRLGEEKRRGITIDIGFAPLLLDGVSIGFVDVPGHERFVKNMLAGATGIDLVVLVVAADESIKPQTREHFDICTLLGVRAGLVALTKADLADAELREIVALEIRDMVKGSFLEGAPIVSVSARTGEGIDALKRSLQDLAAGVRPRSSASFFRLPVDRAFSMKGFGTVVTGTLIAGELADGAEVSVYPEGSRARVRGLQVHGQPVKSAVAGQRTACNLQGMDTQNVTRGHVLAPPGCMSPSSLLDVDLQVLPGAHAPLKDLARVRFHQGTSELLARVKLLGERRIDPGGHGLAQLRLESPGLSLPGDRFVIRNYSPMTTIGGGVVIDAHPEKHRRGADAAREALAALRTGEPEALVLHALDAAPAGLTVADLVVRTGCSIEEVGRIAKRLRDAGESLPAGDRAGTLLRRTWRDRHRGRILEVLERFHAENPLMLGLPREELRERAMPRIPPEIARPLLEGLASEGRIRLEKDLAASAAHRLALGPEDEQVQALLARSFREGGLNPPTLEEIVGAHKLDAARAQRIYHLLLSSGRLVKIKDGKVFDAESIESLKSRLWGLRARQPVIDVASFKELTGTSRKNAIPLLEHLDAEKVTKRKGNDREILPPPGAPAV
jgi:selenocysteine-specific elongation factor